MLKIEKSTVETMKTIVIAVLVTGILAFMGGMHYATQQSQVVDTAVKQAVVAKEAEKPKN